MANQTGQGSDIPGLRRTANVSADLQPVSFNTESGGTPLAGTGILAVGDMIKGVTERYQKRLDIQAAVEGRRSGAVAGMNGIPEHQDDATIRGAAFNQAAQDSVATQFDLQSRLQLDAYKDAHKADPVGFKNAADSYLKGALPKLQEYDPVLAQHFAGEYTLRAEGLRDGIQSAADDIARDRQQEGALVLQQRVQEDMRGYAGQLFSSDPVATQKALAGLTLSTTKLADVTHQFGPDGKPLFSAGQRFAFSQSAGEGMAGAVGQAWIAAHPDMDAAYDTWQKGAAEIAVTDSDGTTKNLKLKDVLGAEDYRVAGEHMLTEISRRRTAQRANVAVVDKGVTEARKLIDNGLNPGADRLNVLAAAAETTQDAEAIASVARVRELSEFQGQARQWRPDELQSWVNKENTRLNDVSNLSPGEQGPTKGVTAAEADRLDLAQKLLASMSTELKRDPLSWGNRVGIVSMQPLSPDDPASMQKRIVDAKTVSVHYGTPLQVMTDEEASQWKTSFDVAVPDKKVAMIGKLQNGFGTDAVYAFEGLSKVSPAIANIGGLMSQGDAHLSTARDFAIGDAAIISGVKVMPEGSKLQEAQATSMGDAYGFAPGAIPGVVDAAERIYTARAARMGKGPESFDQALYDRALQEASGAWWDRSGVQHGGIVEQKSGHSIVLPPNVSEDQFQETMNSLTDIDLTRASVGGGAALYQNGKAMTPEDLKRFWLISTGPGRYTVSTTNPSQGPATFLQGSNHNGIFEMDLNQLKKKGVGE